MGEDLLSISTLPETNILATEIGRPKRKQSSSNHPFSGANLLLVSGSVKCGSEDQVDLYCNVLGKRRFRRKCAFCQCKKFFFKRYSVHLAKLDEIWCQPGSMLELRTKCFDRLTLKGATKKTVFLFVQAGVLKTLKFFNLVR